MPHLFYSIYWPQKEKFLYYEDTYKDWTVFAVEDGSFYYELDTECGTATYGDLVICPALSKLRRVVITPLSFYLLRLRWSDGDGKPAHPGDDSAFAGKISLRNTSRFSANFANMKKAETLDEKRKMQLHNHYVQDLWIMYAEESEALYRTAAERLDRKPPDPLIAKAVAMIQKHAFHSFDLKEIAAELGLSPVRFTQKFKADLGVNPLQYLTSLRLDKAKSLLLETTLTLDQIAECIGYQNGFYLSRIFIKHMGMPPSAYRKTYRI